MYRKNTAGQFLCVQLILTATGAVATGLSPAARRCIDGTFAAGGGSFTEDGSTGSYKYALAQADTNGNDISIIVTATGCIPVCVNFVTTAADPTDSVRFGLTALPNAAAGATNGLPLAVDNSGRVDVLKINGTSQTARDIGASVLLSAGSGTGQLDFTSGVVKANATQWLGGTIPAVNVTGVPLVDMKYTLGTISPAAAGSVAIDWAQVSNKTATVALTNTSINSVNNLASGTDSINTIATSASTLTTGSTVAGTYASTSQLDASYWQIADSAGTLDMYFEFNVGSVGVPTTAEWVGALTTAVNTLKVYAYNWGSTTFEQIGTVTGTSTLITNTLSFDLTTSHVGTGGNVGLVRLRFQNTGLTAANFYTDRVICGYTSVYTVPTTAQIATGVWQDATAGDFTAANSIGKSVMNGVSLGTGLTINAYTGNTVQTGDAYARIGAPTGASTAADIAAVKTDTAAVKVQTDKLTFTVANQIDANVIDWKSATAPAMTGDAFAALTSTTRAEPGQGNPPATAIPLLKIDYLFKAWRNKVDETATTGKLYADDSSTVDQKWTVSDDTTTFTRTKIVTGP